MILLFTKKYLKKISLNLFLYSHKYKCYALGKEAQAMKSVIGEESLTQEDLGNLKFLERFETQFINQTDLNRDITTTLSIAWKLLRGFSRDSLNHIPQQYIDKYYDEKSQN